MGSELKDRQGKVAAIPAPETPEAWTPPSAPTLTPDEAKAAIRSGGFLGVFNAILAKIPDWKGVDHRDAHAVASTMLDQYRTGHGGPEHSAILGPIEPYYIAADATRQALAIVGTWILANPGTILTGDGHSSTRRRVFPWTPPKPDPGPYQARHVVQDHELPPMVPVSASRGPKP